MAVTKPAREPDPLWDAMAERFNWAPVSKRERPHFNALVADLRHFGAEASQFAEFERRYDRAYPRARLTADALVKHWKDFMGKERQISQPGVQVHQVATTEQAKAVWVLLLKAGASSKYKAGFVRRMEQSWTSSMLLSDTVEVYWDWPDEVRLYGDTLVDVQREWNPKLATLLSKFRAEAK